MMMPVSTSTPARNSLDPREWPPLRPHVVESSPKRERCLKAPVLDGRHEHPVLPHPDKPAEITANANRMPGHIDRWYSFDQCGLISQRDIKMSAMDGHVERPALPHPHGKITVRFHDDNSILVEATSTDTVLALKMKIETASERPHDQQQLGAVATLRILKDDWTLGGCGIECHSDSIVVCLLRLHGGAVETSFSIGGPFGMLTAGPSPFQRSDGQKVSPFKGSEGLNGAANALTPCQPCFVSYPLMSEWQVKTGWETAL